jgi:glutaredoxin 3
MAPGRALKKAWGRPAVPLCRCTQQGFAHRQTIQTLLKQPKASAMNTVRMYTTQVCPFCIRAKSLLKQRGVDSIEEIRIDLDPAQRDHMMQITGRRTVPQIFIGQTHVGGCDDLVALDQKGGLMPLLGLASQAPV